MAAALTPDIVHDNIALSVARITAAANQCARALGMDVAQSLITITQRSLEDGLIRRVSYGPKDYINRRGGDLIIDVEPGDTSIKQVLWGQ